MVRLPPTAALRAFESAARHLSYTRAAEELSITQSAVSHQIRHIEQLWELKLFLRRGRSLRLTEAGHVLAPIVRDFIKRLSAKLAELRPGDDRSVSLRVSLVQSFAFKWLVPRLGQFSQQHPSINVWISTTDELIDFSMHEVDVGIRLGHGGWSGLSEELILREYVFPVCSPRFLSRIMPPETPEDLLRYPLIYRHSQDICPRWRDWFRDAGVEIKSLPKGSKFPDTSMAVQAAIDDFGVALARSAHVQDDLATGRLVKLFDVSSPSNVAYYFVCPKGRESEPNIRAFHDWVVEEAVLSQKEFDRVAGPNPIG
jgi:LysR family glycine cleavage system transcriptional activator